jgi:hypothetical protein
MFSDRVEAGRLLTERLGHLEPDIHGGDLMSRESSRRDPLLEHAEEEAEGTEVLDRSHCAAFLELEREEAQGVEVFEDPDVTLPASALKEGSPGHETLTGDAVGLGREDDEDREDQEEESW